MTVERDIDKLVAEKLFGLVACDKWERVNFGSIGGPALMKQCDHPDGACYSIYEVSYFGTPFGGCPRYTSDYNETWKVYEWLEERGLVQVSNGDGDSKDCDFMPIRVGEHFTLAKVSVSAETYGLAICITALEAIGVEVEKKV